MKLIKCSDYVIENLNVENKTHTKTLDSIRSYALFLKRLLELGMFIPCDLDGNVLEKPKLFKDEWTAEKQEAESKQYKEALDRVLFEGFEILKETADYPNKGCKILYNKENDRCIYYNDNTKTFHKSGNSLDETIEDLTELGLELTKAAKQQLN